VIPVLNEEENILHSYTQVEEIMKPLSHLYDIEYVYTENDKRVKVISFSKNFGYQRSILTGYHYAMGDAVIQLDCDLQDPPELIPQLIQKWEMGFDVVYGIRKSRDESFYLNFLRKIFYRLIKFISEEDLPLDAGDFRLCNRKVVDALKHFEEDNPYLRGRIAEIGFRQTGIEYHRHQRKYGESNFNTKSLLKFSLNAILNHSTIPLRLAFFLGLSLTVLSFILLLGYLSAWYIGHGWPRGFATLSLLIIFSLSINSLFLGIIGEYLRRIYNQVKKKPLVIINHKYNIDNES
jgi:dolichol-phosphate mannosyltransferase